MSTECTSPWSSSAQSVTINGSSPPPSSSSSTKWWSDDKQFGIETFTFQDIFETKITSSSLRLCFPNYYGNNTYKEGSEFIQKQFLQLRRNSKIKIWRNYKYEMIKYFLDDRKTTYSHFTCGTDTENIRETVQNNKVNLTNSFIRILDNIDYDIFPGQFHLDLFLMPWQTS